MSDLVLGLTGFVLVGLKLQRQMDAPCISCDIERMRSVINLKFQKRDQTNHVIMARKGLP